jgi:hypothetical protein
MTIALGDAFLSLPAGIHRKKLEGETNIAGDLNG